MPAYGSRAAPGGAPRAKPRPRLGLSSSASTLRRVGSGSIGAGDRQRSEPAQVKRLAAATTGAPARSTDLARSATPVRRTASASDEVAATVSLAKSRMRTQAADPSQSRSSGAAANKELSNVAQASARPGSGVRMSEGQSKPENDGMMGGKLNADGAVCPPWSCILNSKIRYQPTTLVWGVHEIPKGMTRAVKALDARRYQPTSADFGLAFRVRDARIGGSGAFLERICKDTEVPPREGVRSPNVHKFQHPAWWGCGPKDSEGMKLSATYDDLGIEAQEQGIGKEKTHSISAPFIDGRYQHQNPFMAQFGKRTEEDGGIVYDVSVAMKAGCCARDPKCPRPRKRGW